MEPSNIMTPEERFIIGVYSTTHKREILGCHGTMTVSSAFVKTEQNLQSAFFSIYDETDGIIGEFSTRDLRKMMRPIHELLKIGKSLVAGEELKYHINDITILATTGGALFKEGKPYMIFRFPNKDHIVNMDDKNLIRQLEILLKDAESVFTEHTKRINELI